MTEKNHNIKMTRKKHFRGPRHLSFFFVDDTGRVFYFDRVITLVVSFLIVVIVSVLAAGIAVKFSRDLKRENQVLNNELAEKNSEIIQLKKKNAVITASFIKRNYQEKDNASEPIIEVENKNESREKKITGNVLAGVEANAGQKGVNTETSTEEVSNSTVKTEQAISPSSEGQETVVFEVNNFFVSHNPETKKLNVQFKLSKMSSRKGKMGGQTAVILYGKTDNNKIRLVLPVSAKVDDPFTTVVDGKPFLISSYNYIRMSSDFQMDIKFLKNAAVLVCDTEGNKIAEKNFPITIK